MNDHNNNYYVIFKGAKITKVEAKRTSIAIIFGVIGSLIAIFALGINKKIISYGLIVFFSTIGYLVACKIITK